MALLHLYLDEEERGGSEMSNSKSYLFEVIYEIFFQGN